MSNDNGSSFPETFVPARPSRFEANFSHFTVGQSDAGSCPIAVLEIDGQDRSLWLWTATVRSGFKRLRPQQGERLELAYADKKVESASGRTYWDDRVVAPDRPVETIDVDHPLFSAAAEQGEEVKPDDVPF